ncbi:MAG: PLP-dependent aminotransferase family protein [Caldilineaceae bacterium]|nr:PLP-dependent aminotransferase family protein [Caldilineaceae bacterium]
MADFLPRSSQVNRASSVIDFGIGQPSFDLLPLELMRRATAARFAEGDTELLSYGYEQGDGRFRQALADFLTAEYATAVTPQELMITAGASQALALICTLFTKPGDTVFVEEPSYFLALRILREDFGLNAVPIPTNEKGMRMDALEEALARQRPVFVYTIPAFQNPTGHTLSAQRRARLVALGQEYDFLVVADEVYQLLHYAARPPAPVAAQTASGRVLSIGSFSKILAPGLRLGWIQTSPALAEHLAACGLVDSGGGLNHFTSNLVRVALERGWQAEYLQELRGVYRRRIDVMDAALHRYIGSRVRWQKPTGGYFFWLEMDARTETVGLLSAASEVNTGFLPGARCSSVGGLGHCLRLSFAHFGEEAIEEGVARLGQVLASYEPKAA